MVTITGLKTLLSGAWHHVCNPVASQSQKTPLEGSENINCPLKLFEPSAFQTFMTTAATTTTTVNTYNEQNKDQSSFLVSKTKKKYQSKPRVN